MINYEKAWFMLKEYLTSRTDIDWISLHMVEIETQLFKEANEPKVFIPHGYECIDTSKGPT